jgi:hypothetical protein
VSNLDYKNVESDPRDFLVGFNELYLDRIIRGNIPETENPFDFNEMEVIVGVYKDNTMERTKQVMYGSPASILTAITSTLDMLSRQKILEPKIQKDIDKLMADLLNSTEKSVRDMRGE